MAILVVPVLVACPAMRGSGDSEQQLRPRAEVAALRNAQLAANPSLASTRTSLPFKATFVSGSFSWEALDVRWFDSYLPAQNGGFVSISGEYKSCLAIYYRVKNLSGATKNAYGPIPQEVGNAWPTCAYADVGSTRELPCGPIPITTGATVEGVKVLKVGFYKTDILLTPCDDRGELDRSQTIRIPWDDRWSKVHLIPNFVPQNVNAADEE